MVRQAFPVAAALTLGVVIGVYAARPVQSMPGGPIITSGPARAAATSISDPPEVSLLLDNLAFVVDREVAERSRMAMELEALHRRLDDLEGNLATRVSQAIEAQARPGGHGHALPEPTREERLLAAGIAPEQTAALGNRREELELERLFLRDQAVRQGWFGTARYQREVFRLTDSEVFRQQLGDDAYDRYLYATGQPNRIAVARVLRASPAEAGGLRLGDTVVSYAGERVFSSEQLINTTHGGTRGEMVAVEIVRDGETFQLALPRGPIGITMSQEARDPGR